MTNRKVTKNFGSTLKLFRQTANMSQEELSEKSELDRTYISMLERDLKSPTLQTILNICEALGVGVDIFMQQMVSKPSKEVVKKEIKLPLMGSTVACGKPVGDNHFIEKEISLEKLLIKHPNETFFVQACGESMSPVIHHNDYLIIDKILQPKHGQIILAQVENEFTVKRFMKENKQIYLKAENPLFESIKIDDNQAFIYCGTVVSIIRKNF